MPENKKEISEDIMKKFFSVIFMVLLIPMVCYAAELQLSWDPPTGGAPVVGYRLYMSSDNGNSWEILKDNIPADANSTIVTVPDHQLVLIRIAAYNDSGESQRRGGGVYFNSDWMPPNKPDNFGIK